MPEKKIKRKIYKRKITKRKIKNFNNNVWIEALAGQDWEEISNTGNLDQKVEIFTNLINNILNKIANYNF